MKPRLKPQKGWKYRVIIANGEGKYEYDDVNAEAVVPAAAARLIETLYDKREKIKDLDKIKAKKG